MVLSRITIKSHHATFQLQLWSLHKWVTTWQQYEDTSGV